jgi:uncharacterized repeat protein (TIGR03803 family)
MALQGSNSEMRPGAAARVAVALGIVLGLSLGGAQSSQAQTFTVLYTFTGGSDGSIPAGGVVRDAAGNFYGATYQGGDLECNTFTPGCGVVFKLSPAGKETVLHAFKSGASDGANPAGGVVRDAKGNLYGATIYGHEPAGYGTVFELGKTGEETFLHAFGGGSSDGAFPAGGLLRDKVGNLYGTTYEAGGTDNGTLYKVSAGNETTLHAFGGYPTDGANPTDAVVLKDKDGNLYGVTYFGGSGTACPGGCGALYKLSKNGRYAVLHSFAGGTKDGCYPYGTPVMDPQGNLYGTAVSCGASKAGMVWKISQKGIETVLHNFTAGSSDGGYPEAGVIMDSAGNLYGVTTGGGTADTGVLYELDTSGVFTVLHNFVGADGEYPAAVPLRDADGTFYGTATYGGEGSGFGNGTVWKLTPE